MDWRLLEYAKEAEDTASGLHVFLGEIPQFRKDITGYIAELFAISNALHVLHEALEPAHYGRYSGRILKDLEVCLPSLGHTLDDVRDMFSKKNGSRHAAPGAFPGTPPYTLIWQDALADMKAQGISFPVRLELFRTYLQGMEDALKGEEDEEEILQIRARLSKLLKNQEPLDSYFSRLSTNGHSGSHAKTPKPASPKVSRPNIERYSTYPAYSHIPPPAPAPPPPQFSQLGIAPTWGGVIGDIPFVPPPVPEIPQSPTYSTASSHSFSTHSTDSGEAVAHWSMKIFDGRHSSTPFHTLGDATVCLGRDEPRVIEMLDDDRFERVLELPFEATNVWVRLYWRSDDSRARILFLTMDPTGRRMRYCFPLTGLKVIRSESCLQLCRVNRKDGQLDLWARLRFTLYERMVLFYCTVVAMKRQDQSGIADGLEDFFTPGERIEFSGEITDSRYLHAFRIYRDEDSGCVRFEATPRRGPLKTIPIWTAFVTQHIRNGHWMKRVGNATIQFRDLHPYVFCEGYKVPKGSTGRYQLTFTTPEDARNFVERFHRIKTR
ncbi:hypothetical protein P153DRAFT_372890 [Dothidotthia symphoricarpi CBS 119687]|uniref:Uncharacterized protein n=1 Tax=Dothidotthia symphoricarpi CBS 119687 TaxID=1392245 RepID=A0A6A6ANX1_9PLEO|nr:uncharacterized protein P153DRAFT_372890 [Dothidotthia symphoricarpi CBS 119687]KAF2133226.1 hypothetical protein P153DRAFT_372890 [Dothidotthia symphoricarpi CBS 119687]